jgi:hypothetical protein
MARPPEKSPPPERVGLWIEEVAVALGSGLTPSENFAQCWVEVEVKYGQGSVNIPLPALRGRKPYGVTVEKATVATGSLSGAPGIEWEPMLVKGAQGMRLVRAHGLSTGTRVKFRLLVKAE